MILRWDASEWQPCTGNCYNNGVGFTKRSVFCVLKRPNSYNDEVEIVPVSDNECDLKLRPSSIQVCKINPEICERDDEQTSSAYWITEEWSNVILKLFLKRVMNLYIKNC